MKSLNSPQSNGTRWLGNRCHQQDQNISEMQEFLEMPDCFAQKHITRSHSLMQILDNHTLGTAVHMGEVSKYFLPQIH